MKKTDYDLANRKRVIETIFDLWHGESKRELEQSMRALVFGNFKSSKTLVEKMLSKLLDKNRNLNELNIIYAQSGGFGNEKIDYPYQYQLLMNNLESIDNLAKVYGRNKIK